MNREIKNKIEEYVNSKFEVLNNLDPKDADYNVNEAHAVKMINTMVESLQKEDMNNEVVLVNAKKLATEEVKVGYDYELAIKKIETEISKNEQAAVMEDKKIDITRKHDLMKINNDYEINIEKLNIDATRNTNDNTIEKEKLNHTVNNDKQEFELKNKEFTESILNNSDLNKERMIKVVLEGAAVIIPVVFYNVWMNRGFKFEEEGTYTSNTFKNLIGKFKLTK